MDIAEKALRWLFWLPDILDQDERRRRYFLARVSLVLALAGLFLAAVSFAQYRFLGDIWLEGFQQVYQVAIFASLGYLLIWLLNRAERTSSWVLGVLALLLLTIAVSYSDTPREVVYGRSLMIWVIPIAIAPLILPSAATFVAATLATFVVTSVTIASDLGVVNYYAILFFYLLAFALWLSARALEDALRAAQREAEKYRVVIESVADGIVVVNREGSLLDANFSAKKLLGPELGTAVHHNDERVQVGDRVVEFSWSPVPLVGQVAVIRDITRQIEVERAKDAMLGNVSHELRTPLSSISGFAEVIGMMSETPKITDMAKRILVNAGRLTDLVNSLLDHAQIQAGAFRLSPTAFELSKLTNEVWELMSWMAEGKGLIFEILVDEQAPQNILSDFARVRQVFVNLIQNAIKFTDHGSVKVTVFSLPAGDQWGFTVADTGDGIPTSRLPDIFEPFRRGSDYAVRTRQGAGLGLSISKQLVELMGGKIEVRSEVGRGTTFTVTLPQKINQNVDVSHE
jgi:signal transduction histidine kinase